jgi:hypothetical protein
MRERTRSINNTTDFLITPIMYAPLETSLVLRKGTGDPTWSRATKAWGFNELGYLEELASGCAFFGGARLVRNFIRNSALDNAVWTNTGLTITAGQTDYLGGTSAFLLMETAATSNHDIRDDAVSPGSGRVMIISVVAKANGRDQIRITDNAWGTISATFNLSSETAVSTIGTSTITSLGGGYYKCIAKTSGSLANNPFYPRVYIYNGNISYAGDITKGVILSHVQVSSVTGYDASYVPEYVSVGVEASPYFGAGVDGAKYFSTDYTGGRALTNLVGFRREVAATNNLLQSRNLTQNAWGSPVGGGVRSEILTNGTFAVSTDWTAEAAAYWSISGGSLNLNAPDGAAAYSSNSQTYGSLVTGKQYVVEFDYTHTSGSAPIPTLRGSDSKSIGSSTGRKTVTMTCGASVAGYGLRFQSFSACVATIDNITIKEAPVQCAQTATGLDGIANTATTLTATEADAIILQPTSGIASADRCASAYVKRRTGTGTISFTQDGGSTWTDITSQINSSTWSRVQITSTLANPSVGFKISTSGDEIDVDVVQNEAGSVATSPIVTTTATITRNSTSLTYQTASNIDLTVGTVYCGFKLDTSLYSGFPIACTADGRMIYSYLNDTRIANYDGVNVAYDTPPAYTSGRPLKIASAWGGATKSIGVDGRTPVASAFDGSMGSGATIDIGGGTSIGSAYIKSIAIYNYQMTDAQLQEVTK